MSNIQMVVVPNGLTADGAALVRVLVVPRLDDGTLTDFGLDDWPSLLADAALELHVSTGGQSRATSSATLRNLRARSEVWQAFFSGDGSIIRTGSRSGRAGSVSIAPAHGPTVAATALYRDAAVDMAAPGPASPTVSQLLQGWQPTGRTPPGGGSPAGPAPLPPTDFDRVLAMVRQHRTVLEELGLVFELEVDPGELGGSSAGPALRLLSLRCPEQPLQSLVVPPWTWTSYELSDHGFWPASGAASTPQIEHGAIDLRGTRVIDGTAVTPAPPWALTVMDIDGAIDGLNAAAARLARAGSSGPDGQDAVLPGLRSAGLVLLRPNRDADVSSRLSAASRFEAVRPGAAEGPDTEVLDADVAGNVLAAEDLLLGYRVDIRIGDELAWRSLCKRAAAYTINGMPIGTASGPGTGSGGGTGPSAPGQPGSGQPGSGQPGSPDCVIEEGHLASLAATRDENGNLHADEVVLHWNGWSLAVPDVDLLEQRHPGPPGQLPYNFLWTYWVPDQSLPPLRFGSGYQMRIRVADVTGGGLTEDAGDDAVSPTGPIIYTRHDPVQPPTLALTGPATLGAGVDRLVVRSDEGSGTAAVADTRLITPPAASRQLAEQHGLFDMVSDEQSWAWAQRAMRVQAPGTPGVREPAGLADPAANGINAVLPAQADITQEESERIDWYPADTWPDAEPRSIRLIAAAPGAAPGAPAATVGWSGGVLEVQLAKGREVVLELSSTLRSRFLDHFAVWTWLSDAKVPADQTAQTAFGRNPVLSPVRSVQLVHAVRQPLTVPQWTLPLSAIGRTAGSTHADLAPAFPPRPPSAGSTGTDDSGLDPGSTGRLEVYASWSEPAGADVSGAFVHGEPLPAEGPVTLNFLHDFGDTKHRTITYTLTAISRFRQYFDHGDEPDANFQLAAAQAPVNVLSTVRPPEINVTSTAPSFAWTTTTGATRIEHTRSSWRLRLELSGSWYRTGSGELLAVVLAPDGTADGPPFSALGRDPASATTAAGPLLPPAWCAGASRTLPGFPVPVAGVQADLALYDVFADGGRSFCDIELRPPAGGQASYSPFVRLSVARYQPDSLPGLELSAPTLADWVQLLPDRQMIVDRGQGGVTVTIAGLGPATPNAVDVVVEELTGDPGRDQFPETVIAIDGADTAGAPVWRAVSGSTVARGTVGSPIAVSLTAPASGPRRLRIREIEPYGASENFAPAEIPELTERSAFIDVVNLPESWTSDS